MTVYQTREHERPTRTRRERANPYYLDQLLRQVIITANPSRIVLFGSRAKGQSQPDSDWDLFVETDMLARELMGRVRSQHTVETWPLRDGADGTFQALDLMAAAVRGECPPDYSGYQDRYNLRAAQEVIRSYSAITQDPVAALFYFCRDQIAYIDHPLNTQQVQDCRRTLERRTGDCVSKSVCLSTLLATQGIHSRFVAQCPDGAEFSHVYVEVLVNRDWVSLDPVASGTGGRPLGDVGWRQPLPDGGFESTQEIF